MGTTYNIIGSSFLKEIIENDSDSAVKYSIVNANPLFLTDGEKENLTSDKGDWLIMDGTCLGCKVDSPDDISEEIETLARFMRKTWNRKIMFISMRPSAFCARGTDLRSMPDYKPHIKSAEISAKLMDSVVCYIITLPFDCVSKDGKPYHYIPRIAEYIKSVVDVITVKYDRSAMDKLAMECSIDLRRMLCTDRPKKAASEKVEKTASIVDTEDLRREYLEAVAEDNMVKACDICADIVSKGDMWGAPFSEKAYQAAAKVCKDEPTRIGWLRKFSQAGMDWPNPVLFDFLWKAKTPETDAEMVKAVCGMAKRGNGQAIKRLTRAYRDGRGVEMDLDKARELAQKNIDANVPSANIDLFDVLWKIDTPETNAKLVPLVKDTASDGDAVSMVRLARCYREGRGVDKNVEEAVRMLEKVVNDKPAFKKELENTRKLLNKK